MSDAKGSGPQQNTSGKQKKKQGNNKVWFWDPECKYSVILDQVKKMGWKLISDEKNESKANIYWIDVSTIHERFRTIQPWQVINHFPGMPNIARKNRMGQNLNKMAKIFPVMPWPHFVSITNEACVIWGFSCYLIIYRKNMHSTRELGCFPENYQISGSNLTIKAMH